MDKIQQIFDKLEHTPSWLGIKIESIHDKNNLDDTPLHTVCTWGDLEAIKILLEAGADINAIGDQGATPIFNAIISKNNELIVYLLSQGASKNAKIFGNRSLYDYARSSNAYSKTAVIEDKTLKLLK